MATVVLRVRRFLLGNNVINRAMMQYPWTSSVVLTCTKTLAADLVIQTTLYKRRSFKEIDWTRASVFAIFGFGYLGVFQYWLYNTMYFRWFPGLSAKQTLKKIVFDQLIKHPFVYWPTYYFLQASLNEREKFQNKNSKQFLTETMLLIKNVRKTWKNNILQDCKAMWSFGFIQSAISFGIMPLHLRLPWIAFVSFFWTCYLSFFRGAYVKPDDSDSNSDNNSDSNRNSDINNNSKNAGSDRGGTKVNSYTGSIADTLGNLGSNNSSSNNDQSDITNEFGLSNNHLKIIYGLL